MLVFLQDANVWGAGNANRDWLDVMYVAIRAAVFATFVYFYSSLERFVLVTGLGMLLYLYQQGLLALPNIQPQAPQPQAAAPQQPVVVAPAQAQQQQAAANPPQQPAADVQAAPLVADRDGAHVENNNPAAAQQQREGAKNIKRNTYRQYSFFFLFLSK